MNKNVCLNCYKFNPNYRWLFDVEFKTNGEIDYFSTDIFNCCDRSLGFDLLDRTLILNSLYKSIGYNPPAPTLINRLTIKQQATKLKINNGRTQQYLTYVNGVFSPIFVFGDIYKYITANDSCICCMEHELLIGDEK